MKKKEVERMQNEWDEQAYTADTPEFQDIPGAPEYQNMHEAPEFQDMSGAPEFQEIPGGPEQNDKQNQSGSMLRTGLKIIALLVLALVISAGVYTGIVIGGAPDMTVWDAVPKGYRSSVLDDQENVVLNLSGEASNRVYVRLDEIPEDLQHAFVAIEDSRFYKHHGIDVKGIVRAVFRGLTNGGVTEGASTITQQLLKNNVFTDWTEEVTFENRLQRKIQEQYLALKLERQATKDWILENYLNTINLGGGNWGVETAAKYYFDKDISDLSLSECAVLAAITKNPTRFNPRENPEENAERREIVLQYMLEQGYITEEAYQEAAADDVYTRIAETKANGSSQEIMTWFEDALVTRLISDLQEQTGCSEEDAWNQLYKGGLTIYSTENSTLQSICDAAAANDGLYEREDGQVSMVMLDTRSGEVKAMIGGRGEKTASLLMNRATDVVRQPGSTIKIIGEYAAALENRDVTLGTVFDDAPYTYSNGTAVNNASGTYGGMTTIRTAIEDSNNIVALKCFQKEGMDAVWNQLGQFGISTLTEDDRVEALALGGTSGGVTNLELTAAYGTIGRGGAYREPVYYTKVVDRDGNVILENQQETHQAVSPGTAALLTDAMTGVMDSGTGAYADFENMSLAGKSGTTSEGRDCWFVGYSPYYTCGVWGGYDENDAQESSKYVQEIWKTVMSEAHASLENSEFTSDEELKVCKICTKSGLLAVDGVCDSTVQGDMTREEVFVAGTEPVAQCDCHVSVTVCSESGEKATRYCPSTTTRIYLKEASEGTADSEAVLPSWLAESADSCSTHKHFWSDWFKNGNSGGNDDDSEDGYSDRDGGNNENDAQDDGSDSGSSGGNWWTSPDRWWNQLGGGSSQSGSSGNGYGEDSDSGSSYGQSGNSYEGDSGSNSEYGSGTQDSRDTGDDSWDNNSGTQNGNGWGWSLW
ncbi:MAG: PBP1A family penicillin-binding protein [Eubacterium sp.]|nr:PBP1A family penicillin-binding protein [Eubacterium sp.]